MSGRKRTTLDDLLAEVCAYVADNLPGRMPKRLRIELDDGEKISHPVNIAVAAPPKELADPAASELRDAILDALAESPEHLKSSSLAKKVGRRPAGSFRAVLKQMKEDGDITTDSEGRYMLPDD